MYLFIVTINNLLKRHKYNGPLLIVCFNLIAFTGISLRHEIKNSFELDASPNINILDTSLNLKLITTSGDRLGLKDVFSPYQDTWIYFFSPNCRMCNSLLQEIKPIQSENLIFLSFAPISYLNSYQKKNKIDRPLFSLHLKYAKLIGITSVPCLIRVDQNGLITERESNLANIRVKLYKIVNSNG